MGQHTTHEPRRTSTHEPARPPASLEARLTGPLLRADPLPIDPELHQRVVLDLYRAGLDLAAAHNRTTDPEVARRIDQALAAIDTAIHDLHRVALVRADRRARSGGDRAAPE